MGTVPMPSAKRSQPKALLIFPSPPQPGTASTKSGARSRSNLALSSALPVGRRHFNKVAVGYPARLGRGWMEVDEGMGLLSPEPGILPVFRMAEEDAPGASAEIQGVFLVL